ncbi:hypothetical protein EVAR_45418_1 [Eumeta japonica]|uniref:Uncharacterized protein n=1 Tax=Eumeta variegata TaxID=151549 RepID=A0A4C1ZIR5_EUMVA|nr:hypothetical protein EVAR_45418_1 [Eumeta japonica]
MEILISSVRLVRRGPGAKLRNGLHGKNVEQSLMLWSAARNFPRFEFCKHENVISTYTLTHARTLARTNARMHRIAHACRLPLARMHARTSHTHATATLALCTTTVHLPFHFALPFHPRHRIILNASSHRISFHPFIHARLHA